MSSEIRTEKFSPTDLASLQGSAQLLSDIPGITSVWVDDELFMMGAAFLRAKIDEKVVDIVWDAMGMAKNTPDSAYSDVIEWCTAEKSLNTVDGSGTHLEFLVFRAWRNSEKFYFLNAMFGFDSKKVEFGAVAGSTVSHLISALVHLVRTSQPISPSTEEAIEVLFDTKAIREDEGEEIFSNGSENSASNDRNPSQPTTTANALMVEASKLIDLANDESDGPTKAVHLKSALAQLNEIIERHPDSDLAVRLATRGKEGRVNISRIKRQILLEESRQRAEGGVELLKEKMKKYGIDLKERHDAIQRKQIQEHEETIKEALPRLKQAAEIFCWIRGGAIPSDQPEAFPGQFSEERTRNLTRAVYGICEKALYSKNSVRKALAEATPVAAESNDEAMFDAIILLSTIDSANIFMTFVSENWEHYKTENPGDVISTCVSECYQVVRHVLGNTLPEPFARKWLFLENEISNIRMPL